ncbi:MAG TPA: CDP-alcohol phosphatidyltransferase family protein [Acidimicrobiales bacterium]|jgi:cardiolipin synthase|nr:CDP-alcohol phosphatidyltransferase family protein [Acidimicrobiales bacterium]
MSEDRVLTVPNLISVIRLLLVPLFAWLLLGSHRPFAAAVLLAVLGATDWVDGYVARHFHQVSTLGKVLDPTADRVLVATAVITAAVAGDVPVWLCVVVGAREVVVSVGVLILGALGVPRIDVVWVGKAGTLALMVAFPLFLVAHSDASWRGAAHVAAWVFALPAVVLAWTAAGSYIGPARRGLAATRVPSTA